MRRDVIAQYIFIAVALLLLITPVSAGLLGIEIEGPKEQRSLAERPAFDAAQVTTGYYQVLFERHINDTFGLRPLVVQGITDLYLGLFHQSPIDRVIVGKDGWLFLNEDQQLRHTQGIDQYTDAQIDELVEQFAGRKAYFDSIGIPYVYILIPNKQTIYPEYLPYAIAEPEETKTDQLLAALRARTDVHIIDLRPVLLAAKETAEYPLFIPTDTHWQPYAAHIAYEYVFTELAEAYPELFPDFTVLDRTPDMKISAGGDLARMLGRVEDYRDPFVLMPLVEGEEPAQEVAVTEYTVPNAGALYAYEHDDTSLPRAVIHRDSFTSALLPFVSEQFSRTAYIWSHNIFPDIIEVEQPDIVLQFMVERLILK